jgi:hypothetical protein
VGACIPSAKANQEFPSSACPSTAGINTRDWFELRVSRYVFRIPRSYQEEPDRHVDSDVRDWSTSDGRTLTSDYGFYTRPFGPSSGLTQFVECPNGVVRGGPQIVTFTTERGVGAGLYWIVPNGRTLQTGPNEVSPLALWMRAESPRAQDLPELLAIMRSTRLSEEQ